MGAGLSAWRRMSKLVANNCQQEQPDYAIPLTWVPRSGVPEERYAAWGVNRIAVLCVLAMSLLLLGCANPDVRYSDLKPATTATVAGETVTVHLGSDLTASACWTSPKARVEGGTVYIVGYRTLREQKREFAVRLSATARSQPVSVIWVDPDGSKVAIPITN